MLDREELTKAVSQGELTLQPAVAVHWVNACCSPSIAPDRSTDVTDFILDGVGTLPQIIQKSICNLLRRRGTSKEHNVDCADDPRRPDYRHRNRADLLLSAPDRPSVAALVEVSFE